MYKSVSLLLLLSASLCAGDVGIAFVDNSKSQYFKKQPAPTQISPDGFVTTLTSLLSLTPRYYVGTRVSQEIESLLTGDIFQRPFLNFVFRVAGVTQENFTSSIESVLSRSVSLAKMSGDIYQIPKVEDFKILAEPDVYTQTPLEYTQLPQSCASECLEAALIELAALIDAKYEAGSKFAFTGKLTFTKYPGTVMDLSYSADRFWAGEIAAMYVLAKQIESSSVSGLHQRSQYLEGSFSSLKNIVVEYGGSSNKVAVSSAVLMDVMKVVLDTLEKAYEGRVCMEMVFLGEKSMQEVEALYAQKRKLLKTSSSTEPQAEPSEEPSPEPQPSPSDQNMQYDLQWSAQAIAIASFVVLVYFLGAGLYCLCCMKFTQDTLLYSRAKVD